MKENIQIDAAAKTHIKEKYEQERGKRHGENKITTCALKASQM